MDRRIDVETLRAGLDEILASVAQDGTHMVVAAEGQPAVVMLSMRDYLGLMPPPDWLKAAWAHAEAKGLAAMTMEDIDAEIVEARRDMVRSRRN